MINKILIGMSALLLFAAVYVSVSFQKNPSTIESYADVLGIHVKTNALPTLGPMIRVNGTVVSTPVPSPTIPAIQYEDMWATVQNWRTEQGLPAYQTSERLCQIAQQRLTEIQQQWSHEGFSWQRFCPEEQCTLSENLARKYSSEQKVLDGWLQSVSHAENLYKPYSFSCIATDGNYIVHIMGNL